MFEKTHILKDLGIHSHKIIEFNKAVASLSPQDFIENYIATIKDLKNLVVGSDFYFGKDRQGNSETLKQWALQNNVRFKAVELFEHNDLKVSSSKIRHLIQDGQIKLANKLLSRPYCLQSKVIHGQKKGRSIGFPTANLDLQTINLNKKCIPKKGVYACFVSSSELKRTKAVCNIGHRPTLKDTLPLSLEVHLLDFKGDLYDSSLTVNFIDRIREEQSFASLERLSQQIQQDIQKSRQLLKSC